MKGFFSHGCFVPAKADITPPPPIVPVKAIQPGKAKKNVDKAVREKRSILDRITGKNKK